MRRVSTDKPKPELPIWIQDGKLYYTTREQIDDQLRLSGNSERLVRRLIGHGYHLIEDAKNGKRLNPYEVQMVEYGIIKPDKMPTGFEE